MNKFISRMILTIFLTNQAFAYSPSANIELANLAEEIQFELEGPTEKSSLKGKFVEKKMIRKTNKLIKEIKNLQEEDKKQFVINKTKKNFKKMKKKLLRLTSKKRIMRKIAKAKNMKISEVRQEIMLSVSTEKFNESISKIEADIDYAGGTVEYLEQTKSKIKNAKNQTRQPSSIVTKDANLKIDGLGRVLGQILSLAGGLLMIGCGVFLVLGLVMLIAGGPAAIFLIAGGVGVVMWGVLIAAFACSMGGDC